MDKKVIWGIVVISALLLFVSAWFFSQQSQGPQSIEIAPRELLVRDDSYRIATDSASVELVEFSDFQCPACREAHPVVRRLLADYPEELSYIYRHFPLEQTHRNALIAAQVAEAAGEQGKFFQMADLVFERQDEWSEGKEPIEIFKGYAVELGLDGEVLVETVESGKFADKIRRDQADGLAAGVKATPMFFVNGKKVGNLSYEQFKAVIEAELSF